MTFGAIMNLRKLNVTLIEQAFLKEAVNNTSLKYVLVDSVETAFQKLALQHFKLSRLPKVFVSTFLGIG